MEILITCTSDEMKDLSEALMKNAGITSCEVDGMERILIDIINDAIDLPKYNLKLKYTHCNRGE